MAPSSARAVARSAIAGVTALLCAVALQGCSVVVPRHEVGNWEQKANYLVGFQYSPPKKSVDGEKKQKPAILNTCSDPDIASALQCNGHGRCQNWHDLLPGAKSSVTALSFCECDRDWADPECRTPRKSQQTAFVLSIFFGIFGVDQFYLGYLWYGLLKIAAGLLGFLLVRGWLAFQKSGSESHEIFTFGAIGIWYLYDLCRIGSSAVVTRYNFRVAGDLPHFIFVLVIVTLMLLIGFTIAIRSIQHNRIKKAHELLLMKEMEDDDKKDNHEEHDYQPQYSMRQPAPATMAPLRSANFSGYGAMIPRQNPVPTIRPTSAGLAPVTLPPTALPQNPAQFPTALPSAGSYTPTTLPQIPAQFPTVLSSAGSYTPTTNAATVSLKAPPTSSLPPVTTMPPSAPVASNLLSMRSMPPTEYSAGQGTVRSLSPSRIS